MCLAPSGYCSLDPWTGCSLSCADTTRQHVTVTDSNLATTTTKYSQQAARANITNTISHYHAHNGLPAWITSTSVLAKPTQAATCAVGRRDACVQEGAHSGRC
jgi:hypothetical protein